MKKRYVIRRHHIGQSYSFLYPTPENDNIPYVWVRLKDAQEMTDLLNDWSDDYKSEVEEY